MSCDMKDITNKKFSRLLAIKPIGHTNSRIVIWKCLCDCGKVKNVTGPHLRNGSTKSCGCFKAENIKSKFGKQHPQWNGYKEISLTFLSRMISGAKLRNIEWNLTTKYLWKLYLKQNKKCALSGKEIKMPIHVRQLRDKDNDNLASLDRIDSTKGYIVGNVQWVCKRINYMKHTMRQETFLEYVRAVWNHKIQD
jgi:hypothetical protein